MTKSLRKAARSLALSGIVGAGILLAGCRSADPIFSDIPGLPPPAGPASPPTAFTNSSPGVGASTATPNGSSGGFRVGDMVTIRYSGITDPPLPHEERVKEDGMITPPFVGSVVALRKTAGELQRELQQKYDRIYKNLTITVTGQARSYSVGGEVRSPGPKDYIGETTVVKAIQAAGDFTDFGDKKKVLLIHPDGSRETVNVLKAIKDPQYDRPVYPGDRISVTRRKPIFGIF